MAAAVDLQVEFWSTGQVDGHLISAAAKFLAEMQESMEPAEDTFRSRLEQIEALQNAPDPEPEYA